MSLFHEGTNMMRTSFLLKKGLTTTLILAGLSMTDTGFGQASPYRGLWVGSAALIAVNEVTIPLNAANVPVAPNPNVPTPTFDRADLRLIIHVNGAGQASLLKDVAILNRVAGQSTNLTMVLANEADVSLVTDPRLYATFPPQPAMRYASAVFDFGDAKATEALDTIVEKAATETTVFIASTNVNLGTQGGRVQARLDAVALIQPQLDEIADHADVQEAFNQFLLLFNTSALTAIIADSNDPVVSNLTSAATILRDQSFYGDTRGLDMVDGVLVAVNAALSSNRYTAAHRAASSFADVGNLYQRYISGAAFGDMISAAALACGDLAQDTNATASSIEADLRVLPETLTASTEALLAKVQMYDDTRSVAALDAVLAAMAETAFLQIGDSALEVALLCEQQGRSVLADMVARYPLPVLTPTVDYNLFSQSTALSGAPSKAIVAAADAAIQERSLNSLYTSNSLYAAAKVAAVKALETEYNAAARVMRTDLPLVGTFAPGSGDARTISSLGQPSDLGPAGLEGRIYLPASHPTNPFRHRRHPDHTIGFNIERLIRFDFDGMTGDSLQAAGYGVDKISGTYREEIFGLHKPLGPDPVSQPIGLKTEGRFELQRISFIDTLNTL
jgi:hypothetical protein